MEVSMNTDTQMDNVRQVYVYRSDRKDKMKDIHDEKDANASVQLDESLKYFWDIRHRTYTKYTVPVCDVGHQ